MTTTLEAVNEMLEAIGEPPVTTLDTGGSSDAAEAERILGRERKRLLSRGWAVNTDRDIEVTLPSVALTYSATSGSFTYGETVTGGTSSATGTFAYELNGVIFLRPVSGTFVAETVTGATSGATGTITAVATASTARIPIDPEWMRVDRSYREHLCIVPRSGFIYDTANHTFDLTKSVRLDVIIDLAIPDLTVKLSAYIVRVAAIAFQRFIKRGDYDEALARDSMLLTQAEALREDDLLRDTNLLDTREIREFTGNRRDYYSRSNPG